MSRDLRRKVAIKTAEAVVKDHRIDELPVDVRALAESCGIRVGDLDDQSVNVSGVLCKAEGDRFVILVSKRHDNFGLEQFSIAHELGHYFLDGHHEALLPTETSVHQSSAGFRSNDPYEQEADAFAARLLMPSRLFRLASASVGDDLDAIIALTDRCGTSLMATASRFVESASMPAAIVVSRGKNVEYTLMSDELREFTGLKWLKRGDWIPQGHTSAFNSVEGKVLTSDREEHECTVKDWFDGKHDIPMTEEIIGLGRYGRTLTLLSSDCFAEDLEEADGLSWRDTATFRRS